MPAIGERGQAAFAVASIRVGGSSLASEVCALYLAGAGVGKLSVDARLAKRAAAQNREIEIHAWDSGEGELSLELEGQGGGAYVDRCGGEVDPVMRGATVARWALARILERAGAKEER